MPRGEKSSYTDKQKRKALHIEESYLDKGVPEDEAEARAWATVNKQDGGGKKRGSGRAGTATRDASKHHHAGSVKTPATSRTPAERSASAKKAARTRARNAQASR